MLKNRWTQTEVFPRYFSIQMRFLSQHHVLSGSTLVLLALNFCSLLTPSAESPHPLAPRNAFCVFQSTHVNSMLSHCPFSILNKIFLPIGRKWRKNESHIPWLYILRKVNLASLLIVFYKQSCLNQTTKKHQRNHKAPLGLPHTTSAAVRQ